MPRNRIIRENRYWKRVPGGRTCDSCGVLICGFLTPIKNKKTGRVLCPDCYEAGK